MGFKNIWMVGGLLPVLLFSSANSASSSIYCVGKVEDWDVTKAGYFYVDGDWNSSDESQRMCNVTAEYDGVSVEVCNVWVSAIMAATVAQKTVKVKYLDVNSCSADDLGTWSDTVATPEYIRSYK
ncbi:hypothetical protein ACJJIW_13380 [Microbulbifer sp. JMSA004]|uniref:hypothetical protein n=1 Tax=unclassified Microbulbifer TaxID=2619833 RepID=UPI0024AD397C|nr:hypothetical protein [Microbulbifer sp. VAAF005]WHI47990.1 hypothetical protein P0078_06300 [Microbulbifer sp. VAAF005]